MPHSELMLWAAYFKRERAEHERDRKVAEMKAKARHG